MVAAHRRASAAHLDPSRPPGSELVDLT
jgi:hypothetical protein